MSARPRPRARPLKLGEISKLAGLVFAAVLGVLLNMYSARHYTRWDVTEAHRYTLTDATKRTLHDLPDTVEIWVLLGQAEPLRHTLSQLLVAYGAETTHLDVKYVDPDHDPLALEDVRRRFKIESGRSEDGHVLTDAVVVVARGEKRWFLDTTDFYEASEKDDGRVRPREEQALTLAIRSVIGGAPTRLCFTRGHGEAELGDGTSAGLFFLKSVLEKDNYEVVSLEAAKLAALEPFKECAVVVVAGPRGAFAPEEENALRTYLMTGGSALLALGPVPTSGGLEKTGLDRAVAPFGVGLGDVLVVERAEDRALPDSYGARFFVEARPHAVTAGLVRRDDREPPRVLIQLARPLTHRSEPGSAQAFELAVTSPEAFGLTLVDGAATWTKTPEKKPGDVSGPFNVAMASERPKVSPGAAHGPRLVVLGASTVLHESNFRETWALRGAALLVESALSWLASKPEILDVPSRDALPAGTALTEEARSEVRRYVLVFMPLAVALLGLAVGLRRRATEGRPHATSKDHAREPTSGGRERTRARKPPKAADP